MRKIKRFEDFDVSINEELNLGQLGDKFKVLISKIKNLDTKSRNRTIRNFILSILLLFPISNIVKTIDRFEPEIREEMSKSLNDILIEKGFGDATQMRLSQRGWDMIKKHEGYSQKAYKLGDGMITVGWGHAEPIGKSKYKAGQEISRSEAVELLKEDLKIAADGVRRIFSEWRDSGMEVLITQDMFDSLVSIAFNVGVSSLRQSELIQSLKRGEYEEAGKLIKKFKISDKFRGLEKRRGEESKVFLSIFG